MSAASRPRDFKTVKSCDKILEVRIPVAKFGLHFHRDSRRLLRCGSVFEQISVNSVRIPRIDGTPQANASTFR